MIPQQTFESYPVFGDNATKVQPDNAKYSAGFIEGDVYPAEWVNWKWNKDSQGIVDANRGLTSVEAELNNVLTGAGKTADESQNNQLLLSIQKLISDAETRAKLAAHPVGSLYWSSANTDPGTLFGGTWSRVKDKFILAAGDTYSAGDTGGDATVTLTKDQIPAHTHTLNGHTHTFTPAGTISGGAYKFTGTGGTTGDKTQGGTISGGAYSFTGTEVTSGGESQSHTHTVTATGSVAVTTNPTFTGSEHSHSYTPAGSITVKTNPTFTGSEHSHSYTPAGTVSSHAHGLNSHTHSVGAHAHGLNSHTHGIGTIATGSGGSHTHRLLVYTASTRLGIEYRYPPMSSSTNSGPYAQLLTGSADNPFDVSDSTPTTFQSGTNASGYARYGNWGARANINYKRTLVESDGAHTHTMSGSTAAATGSTANSTAFDTGTASGNTANAQPTFTGTAATLKATQGGSISGGAYTFTGTAATLKATAGGTISGGAYSFTGSSATTAANNRGHTHKVTAAGTVAVTTNPTFTGSAHNHSFTPAGTISITTNPTFSGTQGTTSANSGDTSSTGGSGSHNNMPPYKVYYCWERVS